MSVVFKNNIEIFSSWQQRTAFFCSQAAKVGAVAGAVSLLVSAYFGYNCLYPATISGFCFSAYAGNEVYKTNIQEILNHRFKNRFSIVLSNILPESVKQYLFPLSIWREVRHWRPISNDVIEPPFEGILDALGRIFSSSPPRHFIEVRAFTNGVGLKYETLNLQTLALRSGDIPLVRPIEEMIAFLQDCCVALGGDGVPVFSAFHYTLRNSNGDVVTLLLRNNDLVWSFYDKNCGRVICTQKNSLSRRCSVSTCDFFNRARWGSLIDRVNLVRECVLYKYDCGIVYLEPIHKSSGFNEGILISKFMWLVTLIRRGGPLENHAKIVIEGINDGFFPEKTVPIGEYFVCLTDLLGEQEIEEKGDKRKVRAIRVKVTTAFKVKYVARAASWKRPSREVKNMILDIIKEQANPPSGFSLLGRHSMLASRNSGIVKDSCITWAIDKLARINIVLEKNTYGYLFTNTSLYTPLNPSQKEKTPDTFFFFFTDDCKLI